MCVCLSLIYAYIYTVYGGNHLEVDTVEDGGKKEQKAISKMGTCLKMPCYVYFMKMTIVESV